MYKVLRDGQTAQGIDAVKTGISQVIEVFDFYNSRIFHTL
jgi:hypothetical protein